MMRRRVYLEKATGARAVTARSISESCAPAAVTGDRSRSGPGTAFPEHTQTESVEEAIFAIAVQLPLARRSRYLKTTCGGQPGLRRRIEALLGGLDRAGGLLEEPAYSNESPHCGGLGRQRSRVPAGR